MRWPDPCSLDTMSRSRHDASRGWRPSPCSFNTIPRFWHGASLRGLRLNGILLGFISIKVAKFLHWLDVPNTTLLLYQGLGPAMLGHQRRPTIGGVSFGSTKLHKKIMPPTKKTLVYFLSWIYGAILFDIYYEVSCIWNAGDKLKRSLSSWAANLCMGCHLPAKTFTWARHWTYGPKVH